jgi:hypothetical protein
MQGLFGGSWLAALFDPFRKTITTGTAAGLGGMATLLATAFGAATDFDDGGVASGVGVMPKGTIRPERVLSPDQTAAFERFVTALERGNLGSQVTIHAPFNVAGGRDGGEQARDRLLALLS